MVNFYNGIAQIKFEEDVKHDDKDGTNLALDIENDIENDTDTDTDTDTTAIGLSKSAA
jgi:hypothetical protein